MSNERFITYIFYNVGSPNEFGKHLLVGSNGLDSFSVVWRLEHVGRSICVV